MKYFFFSVMLLPLFSAAQPSSLPLSISLSNNGTSLPGAGYAGVFSKTVHPGITLGTYHLYRKKDKSELFQTAKLGYFYHRHAQHAVQLYSELGYRYLTKGGFYGEGLLGLGYLHSFADVQQFTWKDGQYVKKANLGRPQFMASCSIGAGYDLQAGSKLPVRLFLQYQFWMQTPFVNKYVPLLPNAALHIGAIYQIPKHQPTAAQ